MNQEELNQNLVANLKQLLEETNLPLQEISALTKIPISTLYSIVNKTSCDPRLSTLYALSKFFNVTLSQLIGEISLNWKEINIPLITWNNLNSKKRSIDFNLCSNTKFISTQYNSSNPIFALVLNSKISHIYRENSILIIEITDTFYNGETAVISISFTTPTIKKIVMEGPSVYLESITHNLPLVEYTKDSCHIFGIIREVRSAV